MPAEPQHQSDSASGTTVRDGIWASSWRGWVRIFWPCTTWHGSWYATVIGTGSSGPRNGSRARNSEMSCTRAAKRRARSAHAGSFSSSVPYAFMWAPQPDVFTTTASTRSRSNDLDRAPRHLEGARVISPVGIERPAAALVGRHGDLEPVPGQDPGGGPVVRAEHHRLDAAREQRHAPTARRVRGDHGRKRGALGRAGHARRERLPRGQGAGQAGASARWPAPAPARPTPGRGAAWRRRPAASLGGPTAHRSSARGRAGGRLRPGVDARSPPWRPRSGARRARRPDTPSRRPGNRGRATGGAPSNPTGRCAPRRGP